MEVPFIDLSRILARVRDDALRAWGECLDAREFVRGPRVNELERRLATTLGVARVVCCASGTDALLVALKAVGVRRGMKVAMPNLTFWATFEAVAQLGATPVLVDVDPDDLQMSFDELRAAHHAHRLDAAILVHLYGWASAKLREMRAFCRERAIPLVEDGAQCFGVEAFGEPVLAGAEVATLSFHPAKVLGGAMDGGAIALGTPAREALVRSLCNHGREAHYSHAHVGWNSRMGGLQAAFLLRMLDELPGILESRRTTAGSYRRRLASSPRVRVYGPPPGIVENGYLNVLAVEDQKGEEVVEALAAAGVGAARTYPAPIDAQRPARSVGAIAHGELAHSRSFCERVVNLPLFYGIREDERERAARALLAAAS
jgi:dTDP-4-amino-4,6-dideoxygalactose transaminase